MDIIGYEAHDVGLGIEALASGFWMDQMFISCRTGESIAVPSDVKVNQMSGSGFFWYDTGQDHVISNSVFRNCGYRSESFADYNTAVDRGCGDSTASGCRSSSTTFGFLAHSDQFVPEIMQGTKAITFDNCGRRFQLKNGVPSTVSGRIQNWVDSDGSVTGFGEPSIIGSGDAAAGTWWDVDQDTRYDPQGPLFFIKQSNGPERGLGHFEFIYDHAITDTVGKAHAEMGSGEVSHVMISAISSIWDHCLRPIQVCQLHQMLLLPALSAGLDGNLRSIGDHRIRRR